MDFLDSSPKYIRLYKKLLEKIENSDWKPYDPIPPERVLEEQYRFSRTTVRQAISIMVSQGYLYREQGKGTFVAPPKFQQGENLLRGFSESMVERGMKPGQKILSFSYEKPTAKVRGLLELQDDDVSVLQIERLRLANEMPVGIQTSYLSLGEGQTINEKELLEKESIYTIMKENFELIPKNASETVEASLANCQESKLLNVEEGFPILVVERVVWSQRFKPMEFTKARYRGDKYKYQVKQTI